MTVKIGRHWGCDEFDNVVGADNDGIRLVCNRRDENDMGWGRPMMVQPGRR